MPESKIQVAYVCAPYRNEAHNEVHRNIERARNMATGLWRRGYAVVCPHMNSALMSGITEEENFLVGYREILRRCDVLAVCGSVLPSEGMKAEIEAAEAEGLEIIYL